MLEFNEVHTTQFLIWHVWVKAISIVDGQTRRVINICLYQTKMEMANMPLTSNILQ